MNFVLIRVRRGRKLWEKEEVEEEEEVRMIYERRLPLPPTQETIKLSSCVTPSHLSRSPLSGRSLMRQRKDKIPAPARKFHCY